MFRAIRGPFGKGLVVLAMLAAATLACATTPAPTSTPTPPPSTGAPAPLPAGYDGVWVGVTTQGYPITTTVANDVVTQIEFTVLVQGQGWRAESSQTRPVAAPIADDSAQVVIDDAYDGWYVEVSGTWLEGGELLAGVLYASLVHPQG
jgi:hypothetical protein